MSRTAEFFAGLESAGIETVFANDVCPVKATLYRDNWGGDDLHVGDIRALSGDGIPDCELATASFPCTDLSLAGRRQGLRGAQSSLIRDFFRILGDMKHRAPATVLIENVPGFLTANGGADWRSVITALNDLGYATDHLVINANAFVPQSRARVFMIAQKGGVGSLPEPPPACDDLRLVDIAEEHGDWWPPSRLEAFLLSLSPLQECRVRDYQARDAPHNARRIRPTGHPAGRRGIPGGPLDECP